MSRFENWRNGIVLIISLLTFGCGPAEKSKAQVFPVSGKVTARGKPPAGAEVRMHPKFAFNDPGGRSIEPFGVVQADGSFKIGMYSGDDGAVPGEYALTISWPKIKIEAGEEIRQGDQFNGKYEDVNKPIATVTVKEGDNVIPEIKLP